MAQLKDTMVQGDLRVTGNIYGNINGNAATASAAQSGSALETAINGKASSTHTHGNIANGGTLSDTAAAAAGNDYVVIRDADNAKIQTSTIKGTDVADAVSKKHSHSTLTLSTTAQKYDGSHTLALPSTDPYTSARTPASHTHGNIANGGTLSDTAAAAAGNDYVVIRDADNSKIQTSTIKGTDVADAVSKKHSHSTLTLSTTAQKYDGSHTLALPSSDPYTSARTPASHTHGNIQNGGTLQTNDVTIASGDKLVITDSSDSSKIARASISFDGSTTSKALTPKGTFETFLTSHQSLSGYVPTSRTINSKALTGNISLTASDVGAAPSSTVSCTTANVKSALGTGSGTSKYLREDGTWQTPPDTNTDTKVKQTADNTSSGTGFEVLFSATGDNTTRTEESRKSNKLTFQPSTGTLTATKFSGALTGNVTGNCSGSSGSCTGNAATATKATQDSEGYGIKTNYMRTTSGNKSLSFGLSTIIGKTNDSDVKLVMPEANADVFEVSANSTSFSDVLAAYNAHKKLILQIGYPLPGTLIATYNIPLNRIVYSDDTPVIFVWVYTQDSLTGDTNRGVITTWSLGSTGWASDEKYTYYSDTAGLCEKASGLIDFGNTSKITRVGWSGSSIGKVIATGDSKSLAESSFLAGYYVSDGMGHVKDVKAANVTVGNATKWNGWSIVVGSTGTDANTLYFV